MSDPILASITLELREGVLPSPEVARSGVMGSISVRSPRRRS